MSQSVRVPTWFEQVLPWMMLAALALLTFTLFFRLPFPGFRFGSSGDIIEVYIPDTELQVGDRLVAVGALPWSEYQRDSRSRLTIGPPGSILHLELMRGEQPLAIQWVVAGPTAPELIAHLNSEWWLAYVFWLAGTLTWLLVRPKDSRWWLLTSFNYLTALWLAAGGITIWRIGISAFILRAAIWLCVPVYLHLHWEFPRSLRRLPRFIPAALYTGAIVLIVGEWFHLLPLDAYLQGFLFAVVGSLLLIAFRVLRRPLERPELGILGLAVVLAFIPLLTATLARLAGVPASGVLQGGAVLALPALPAAYFFILYRRQTRPQLLARTNRFIRLYFTAVILVTGLILALSLAIASQGAAAIAYDISLAVGLLLIIALVLGFAPLLLTPALSGAYYAPRSADPAIVELRVNRLLTPYLFFALLGALILGLSVLAASLFPGREGAIVISAVLAALAALLTRYTYQPFSRFVDERILGVPAPPSSIVANFAERATTILDRDRLIYLITLELLPSLSVSQSAILTTDHEGRLVPFCSLGEGDTGQGATQRPALSEEAEHRPPWVRLALPLQAGNKALGVWWFGRRDPDDLYSRAELPLFQTLANQTALALTNVEQIALLQALYREDVTRHEAERARLARLLHDDVLNELALLALYAGPEGSAPEYQSSFEQVVARIRRMIAGLRPAMLQYGLWAALEEMIDDLSERNPLHAPLYLEIDQTDFRYPDQVELQLFRIVQQATGNALKHAQPTSLRIGGQLAVDQVELFVQDDGIGFPAGRRLDLNALLTHKHFGLAGMHERAALIGATLTIASAPRQGTRVSIIWQQQSA